MAPFVVVRLKKSMLVEGGAFRGFVRRVREGPVPLVACERVVRLAP